MSERKLPTQPGIWWVIDNAPESPRHNRKPGLHVAHVWDNGQCHVQNYGTFITSPWLEWVEEIHVPEKYKHLSFTEQLKQAQKANQP